VTGPAGVIKRILLYEPREAETPGPHLVEYLGNEGFVVERATTPEQAVEWACNRWYRAYVFTFETARDKRALDEIQYYLNQFPLAIPKIIHADIQGFLDINTLQRNLQRSHTRVDFVPEKEYGPLLECLWSFEKDDRWCFNDQLRLESIRYVDPVSVMMGMLERVDPIQGLSNKIEIEDLFRRVFIDCDAIEIEKELWHKSGRVALLLRACFLSRPDERFIGVLAKNLAEPNQRQVKPVDVSKVIRRVHSQATSHYSLTVYQLEGDPDWRKLRSIQDFFQMGDWERAGKCLMRVSDYIIGRWQRSYPRISRQTDLSETIRALLDLEEPSEIITRFKKQVRWLEEILPAREGIGLKTEDNWLYIQLPNKSIQIAEPVGLLQAFLNEIYPGQLTYVPAQIDPATIFVDPDTGYVWLTELDGQGGRPRYWSEVDMEFCVRAAIVDSLTLDLLTEKELVLDYRAADQYGIYESDVALGLITSLRNEAGLGTENQQKDYQVVLVYKILSALCRLDLSVATNWNVRECYRHFLQLALILQGFLDRKWIQMQARKNGFIEYDPKKDVFIVDGREFEIADREKQLLKFFIEHASTFLSYEMIARDVLSIPEDHIKKGKYHIRNQIQQIKGRVFLSLQKISPGREYFDKRQNGYFFQNPPWTRKKKLNQRNR
jgi:hypothetical protein